MVLQANRKRVSDASQTGTLAVWSFEGVQVVFTAVLGLRLSLGLLLLGFMAICMDVLRERKVNELPIFVGIRKARNKRSPSKEPSGVRLFYIQSSKPNRQKELIDVIQP